MSRYRKSDTAGPGALSEALETKGFEHVGKDSSKSEISRTIAPQSDDLLTLKSTNETSASIQGDRSNPSQASRRHGRFLVQPLMDTSARNSSPATKPPVAPTKMQSSPTPSGTFLTERRPSRIIGRFEVSELFDDQAACGCNLSPSIKSVDAVQNELNIISETCATTPVKEQAEAG
jgi:hypothetical protein